MVSSFRVFSTNKAQSEAGSTTTASRCLPRCPPLAFCASISISMVSVSVVAITIVPDSECRTPTLIVSAYAKARGRVIAAAAGALDKSGRLEIFNEPVPCSVSLGLAGRGWPSWALAAALAGDRKAGVSPVRIRRRKPGGTGWAQSARISATADAAAQKTGSVWKRKCPCGGTRPAEWAAGGTALPFRPPSAPRVAGHAASVFSRRPPCLTMKSTTSSTPLPCRSWAMT